MGKSRISSVAKVRQQQGDKLREARRTRSISRSDFADALGVTIGAVSQWECGRTSPRMSMQIAIARLLGSNPFDVDLPEVA